jgi:hypothetical protein
MKTKHIDFSEGTDSRGDDALFIEQSNFHSSGWELKKPASAKLKKLKKGEREVFFRVIINGEETSSHGWVTVSNGKIFQWG